MGKRKQAKKKVAKKVAKKQTHKTEIVVRVQAMPNTPTVSDLSEPERDGKKLTIPKTWLNEAQIIRIVQKTPPQHVYQRPGKGGKKFDYVTGSYVEKVLNFVFAWNWDFEVVNHGVAGDFIWVQGKLTVRGTKAGEQIVKTQFGRAEIKYARDKKHIPENYLDFGNDLKAATTDALKKCASLLGIASDIYGKAEYKQETDRDPREDGEKVVQLEAPPEEEYHCEGPDSKGCRAGTASISKQEHDYSMKVYKKSLCRECQKEAK